METLLHVIDTGGWKLLYSPSHCWYYKFNPPLPVEQIPPTDNHDFGYKFPKKITEVALHNLLTQTLKELENDIGRYLECCFNYAPEWDEVTLQTKNEGREMSLSLKYNHISYNKALLIEVVKSIIKNFGEQSYTNYKNQWKKITINNQSENHLSLSELVE